MAKYAYDGGSVICYDKDMRKIWGIIVAAVVLVVAVNGVAAAASNDFSFTAFEADYYLDRDSDGRSTLKTVERLTANFPTADQNHGIERAIPRSYQGHPTSLRIESVKNEQGQDLPYETYESGDNEVVRIGDADTYVHGIQTYVLTYMQRDVTATFSDRAEFYWDTNGTDWRQPFERVVARLHIVDSLKGAVQPGQMACYVGTQGSTDRCDLRQEGDAWTTEVSNLGPGSNVTLAVGFAPNTFAGYEPSVWDRIVQGWLVSLIVTSIGGVAATVWLTIRYYTLSNRKKDIGTIPTEYIPPKGVSVLLAEQIGEGTRAGMAAQIVDLAVRHYVKVYQIKEKSTFKNAEYELELVKSIETLSKEEQLFVTTLFGEDNTAVGSRLEMKKLQSDYKLASKFYANTQALQKNIKGEYGLRQKANEQSRWFMRAGIVLLVASLLTVSPVLLVAAIVAYASGSTLYPLTDKGVDLRRYLEGLKRYIGVAEEERLKMLQSPEGAEKAQVANTDDPKQLVKLYERVLPYAILFGQEKDWNKQLGQYYERAGTDPNWYSGNVAFNAAVFSSAMNDFTVATNSYAASTSSSSSGSSGGGSSGGGGGGGGGGGW